MKRILCFGDSLTWGYDPAKRVRFEEDSRWPCVMQAALGDDYKVIEEGQNGRTIATEDPAEGEKNGLSYIGACLESHTPSSLITATDAMTASRSSWYRLRILLIR